MYSRHSLVPSPPHPSFCLAAVEKKRGKKTGVGRTGNEATPDIAYSYIIIAMVQSTNKIRWLPFLKAAPLLPCCQSGLHQ